MTDNDPQSKITAKQLVRKTIIYRLIALVLSILLSYLVMWGKDNLPGSIELKSVVLGVSAWIIASITYLTFEWIWNNYPLQIS